MVRSMLALARWLGPWMDARRSPDVATRDEFIDEIRVRIFRPRSGLSASPFLMAPGLHFQGPDDPRMDRFCRVLANAGHLVIAPFVPSYLALVPDAKAIADFERVFTARARWTREKPTVFSISFGSLLAFSLAAKHGDQIASTIVFGGYADFHATMRFCLTGAVDSGRAAARDPLNQPVVLMNLLDHLSTPCPDHAAVRAAWRVYVERTWGRPEMKARERFTSVANAIDVQESVRELFHIGVGTKPGAAEMALDALTRFDASALDPTPYLAQIRGRVDLVHGIDDDVIPFEQSQELARRLVHADVHTHITGLYGHTGAQSPEPSALVRELATMLGVLRVLAR